MQHQTIKSGAENMLARFPFSAKTIDDLTDLPNRFALFSRKDDFFVALFDIRYFSLIAKSYKSETSNDILLDFFIRISAAANNYGYASYRYDIDIAAIASNGCGYDQFVSFCSQLHNEMSFYFFFPAVKSSKEIAIRTVCGISSNHAENKIHSSETALSEAKEKNIGLSVHNEVSNFEGRSYKKQSGNISLFYTALKEGRVRPAYQPIMNIKTGEIVKYEALARIIDHNGQSDKDAAFVENVYRFGLNIEFNLEIFKKIWEDIEHQTISFNVSLTDIRSDRFCTSIYDTLTSNKKKAKQIIFEIIECENISGSKKADSFINTIKKLGSHVAIDDFGSGYSSFEKIASAWKVDILKIDGSIIKKIETDPVSASIVRGIVQIAQENNIKTVAEYVSSLEIYEAVKSMGVDFAQGYYVGTPSLLLNPMPSQTQC